MVECQLPKLNVAGSSPVSRSTLFPRFSGVFLWWGTYAKTAGAERMPPRPLRCPSNRGGLEQCGFRRSGLWNSVAVSGQENSDWSDSLRYRSGPWKTMLFHARIRMDAPMDPIGRIGERTRHRQAHRKNGVPIGSPETFPD